jgi:transcription elongation GreA/GreB family factor
MAAVLAVYTIARIRQWRRKTPDEIERLRSLDVHRRGRITQGHIVDIVDSKSGTATRRTIVYSYEVAGVSYEVGQDVTSLSGLAPHAHNLAGQNVSVKYDPKQPTNSIIACEGWCGIKMLND